MGWRDLWQSYRLVWKRRRLLWRAVRSRRHLSVVSNRSDHLGKDAILCFMCVRNESLRIRHHLDHHRALGVSHFIIVDNGSTDDTAAWLADQPDVSLWRTEASYREARYGVDWINWLLLRYGHGHWCLVLDADELFDYLHSDKADLRTLTQWLTAKGQQAMGALMLDLYPAGPLGTDRPQPAQPDALPWFDPGPYRSKRQTPLQNLWVQGGVRERVFFSHDPSGSPTLNKLPLVYWRRRYAFVNSTHSLLPRRLNLAYDGPGGVTPAAILLHTKFLPDVLERAEEDLERGQHFYDSGKRNAYYQMILQQPELHDENSLKFSGLEQLERLGLINSAGFSPDT